MNVSAPQCVHTFLHALFPRACVWLNYPRYPTVVCDLFRQSTTSDWYDNWKKYPSQSLCLYHPFYFFSLIPYCILSPYRSPPANQRLSFSSSLHLFLHFPIHSSQPPHDLIIIFSLSLTPLSPPADWQCRHAEVNWDVAAVTGPLYWLAHLHHPSRCPLQHTLANTRTHTACSNRKPVQVPGLVN